MRCVILFFLLLINSVLIGQQLTESFVSFELTYGPKSQEGIEGEYELGVLDTDQVLSRLKTNLKQRLSNNSLYLGMTYGKFRGFDQSIYFDLGFGDLSSVKFGYALGFGRSYDFGIFNLLIRPQLGISYGTTTWEMGEMPTSDVTGIRSIHEVFEDGVARADLTSSNFYLTPSVDFSFLIKQRFALKFTAGYDYVINDSRQQIKFTSIESSKNVKVDLDDKLIHFSNNEYAIRNNLFSSSSVRIQFGLGYYWNRD